MAKSIAWKMNCAVLIVTTAILGQGQTFKTLLKFNGTNGASPLNMNLVQGRDGNLYGTTGGDARNSWGTVFTIGPLGLTTLYNFCSRDGCADGYKPNAGLVLANDGSFYGTTREGGPNSAGTVFKITRQGNLTTLYNFCSMPNCVDGASPYSTLVQGTDGNLYGTTYSGGEYQSEKFCPYGCGTAFRISTNGDFTTIHSFDDAHGSIPTGSLIQGIDGKFYGTTVVGGTNAVGVVFTLTLHGVFDILHNFAATEGNNPLAGLIQAADGNFYGTTTSGGVGFYCNNDNHCGTVFRITSQGVLTTIYNFCVQSGCPDGFATEATLTQATDGNLYASNSNGGANGGGTIFQITTGGSLEILYSFCTFHCTTGRWPLGGLSQSTNGLLYGTTWSGGNSQDDGTVFSLDMGLGPFVTFVRAAGKVGQTGGILGQGFTGTTSVSLNGIPASFTVVSDTFIKATVPAGATTGYVTVTTPTGTLTSNVPFHVIP
jgi:uncharacterized repeat protein (TIGR03803 family)